ncbi:MULTISPECIES: C40 family peptidase [unclassified Lysobacter]|uniref:C40 family peptidase n=1 Tax=unclassified Lysobacter TaxID=2635362 RepID=UPI001C24B8EE|nr:C40 family peptidase [Lysobacter sp. MMG2]MBU8975142.1 C40 family peptidase [Lysobacter sp. MMG2]
MPHSTPGANLAPTSRNRHSARFALAAALALLAAPAIAQQMPSSSLAGDSADGPAPVAHTALPESMNLSDRALLLATDLNRLLAPTASANDPVAQLPAEKQSKIKTVLTRAMALLGTPYRWGGSDPDKGFDCSGLVGYVFRNALGIELPRVSREMAKSGELIADRAKLNEGDLVFFGRRGRVDHVGIYVGEGRFVHAPSRGKDVQVSSLETGYWSQKFMEARRIEGI